MLVLDVCVGSEKIYFGINKNLKDSFLGIDIRKGDFTIPARKDSQVAPVSVIVKPTILANMKSLPLRDKSVNIIIMDPPHLSCNKESILGRAYGSWTKEELISTVFKANEEFKRVLVDNGTFILKILPVDKDRYISLLTNFIFFLPVQTVRQNGCFTSKEAKAAAIWLIGIKK